MFKFIKKRKKTPEVKFFTENVGLSELPETKPQPAFKFFPDWFKKVPKQNQNRDSKGTIKQCPVFAEYLTQGYIIPMWCDTKISIDKAGNVSVNSADPSMTWEMHPHWQYLDFLPNKANANSYVTIKAKCPWFLKTDKGYSVYQTPLYYHFQDYQILPGSINTDYHHEINQQILIKKDTEIFIERGEPFAWYIPYKRQSFDYIERLACREDKIDIKRSLMDLQTKFSNAYKLRLKKIENER